jgi:hypothetical protein
MLKAADEQNRKIVPRWRSIAKTPPDELKSHKKQNPISHRITEELEQRIAEYHSLRTDDAATELVWAAKVFGSNEKSAAPLREIWAD